MIKVGVIGYGYSAKTFHIPLIQTSKSLELVAIVSSQKEIFETTHIGVSIFETVQGLIESKSIDLVIITAPNDVHFPLAKYCLENGINVVVEKPMVTTSSEAEELIAIAKKRSLILSVYHNRRWDGDFITVKNLLENNMIGDIRLFESHFDRFRPNVRQRWREKPGKGTGIWFDLGPHLIDQAVSLFGLPIAITGRCLTLRKESETTDYFHVLLHYKKLEVILHASPFSAAPNTRFRIEGTKGSYIKYGLDPQEEQLKSGMTPDHSSYGVENPENYGHFYSETSNESITTEDGCYQQYYSAIAETIKTKGISPIPVDPEDAIEVLKILEIAEKSSKLGKTLLINELDKTQTL